MNRKVNKLTFPQLTSLVPRISSSVPWKINNAMFKESTGFGNNVNNFGIWSASWNLTHRRHLSCSSLIRRILSWSSFSFVILSSRSPSSSIFFTSTWPEDMLTWRCWPDMLTWGCRDNWQQSKDSLQRKHKPQLFRGRCQFQKQLPRWLRWWGKSQVDSNIYFGAEIQIYSICKLKQSRLKICTKIHCTKW